MEGFFVPLVTRPEFTSSVTADQSPKGFALHFTPKGDDARTGPAHTVTAATPAKQKNHTPLSSAGDSRETKKTVTPVKPKILDFYLQGYDQEKRSKLVEGFRSGFDMHCTLQKLSKFAANDASIRQNSEIVAAKLQEELESGRIKGPFKTPPFEQYHVSPLKLVPKKTPGKFRLIHNLSFPYDHNSVNASIDHAHSTVQYSSIQDAIRHIQAVGPRCFMVKSDIANAFRIIPIAEKYHHLLCFKFRNEYYYDTCLAMGASCSCQIFEEFSSALQWILEKKFKIDHCTHILDDFLFISASQALSKHSLNSWLTLADHVGVPLAWDKTTEPAQLCIFAGIELCTISMSAQLPLEKLRRYGKFIEETKTHRKITLQDMQSLIGCLQFATSVVLPGRAFLRRLIDTTIGIRKPFHYVTVNTEAKSDLHMWQDFLQNHNGKSIFLPAVEGNSNDLNLFTDASSKACGAVYKSSWFMIPFPLSWQNKNIAFLELYPILVALLVFGQDMNNSRVCFHTENQAISHVINKQSSKDKEIMKLIRPLVLCCMNHNISFKAKYIPGVTNVLPDRISRFQVTSHLLRKHRMSLQPTAVPRDLLPENFSL